MSPNPYSPSIYKVFIFRFPKIFASPRPHRCRLAIADVALDSSRSRLAPSPPILPLPLSLFLPPSQPLPCTPPPPPPPKSSSSSLPLGLSPVQRLYEPPLIAPSSFPLPPSPPLSLSPVQRDLRRSRLAPPLVFLFLSPSSPLPLPPSLSASPLSSDSMSPPCPTTP
ncbi:hypothetical protein ACLOJK_036955 [Asimina triloba]